MRRLTIFILLAGAGIFLSQPSLAITIQNPIKYGTIPEVINAIISFLIIVSFPLLAGAIIYGGLIMITAAGDPKKFENGWKTILFAIFGFIIILLAKGIVLAIAKFLK